MDITGLKGIGPKTGELFDKLGIRTTNELLRYYPVCYKEYSPVININEIKAGEVCAVKGIITSRPVLTKGRRVSMVIAKIEDETGSLKVMWFNSPYLLSRLKRGNIIVCFGKVSYSKNSTVMDHPEIFDPADYEKYENTLKPVYSLTKGLKNNTVIKAVKQCLETGTGTDEFLSPGISRYNDLIPERDALFMIHFPNSGEELAKARKRIIFDEFFLFIMEMKMLKEGSAGKKAGISVPDNDVLDHIIASLPFELTAAQKRVWNEIKEDITGPFAMNRLLEGDVGSGKTILAFLAMSLCALGGCQAVLMAPTQVLAVQHYESFKEFEKTAGDTGLKSVLLTGAMTEKNKRLIKEDIKNGRYNIIIGTHALIQDDTKYSSPGLVITDEQHRFGVRARKALIENGNVNMLVMSATPIPRTLGLIYYGDLDISILDEKPSDRLRIKNAVVDTGYLDNALKFIEKQTAAGRQAYIICPMIEENEESDLTSVTGFAKTVKSRIKNAKTGILHGRLTPAEKDKVMERFAAGQIDILVSTTVVEVGIDVPNATVMLIMNAERFGLATLHQLRGRVGRGREQSYCIFMAGELNDRVRERLEILQNSNDGFEIAKKDLEFRGPGDVLGLRQSGDMHFALADISRDRDILLLASQVADSILKDDPGLVRDENLLLGQRLRNYIEENERNIVL